MWRRLVITVFVVVGALLYTLFKDSPDGVLDLSETYVSEDGNLTLYYPPEFSITITERQTDFDLGFLFTSDETNQPVRLEVSVPTDRALLQMMGMGETLEEIVAARVSLWSTMLLTNGPRADEIATETFEVDGRPAVFAAQSVEVENGDSVATMVVVIDVGDAGARTIDGGDC